MNLIRELSFQGLKLTFFTLNFKKKSKKAKSNTVQLNHSQHKEFFNLECHSYLTWNLILG